jgi:hypothetical protein
MLIQRTDNEIIIRLPASINTDDLQDFLDYARYTELTSKFKITQKEVDKFAKNVNKSWWSKNRKSLTK